MSGNPFAGFGQGNSGAENLAYQAELQEWQRRMAEQRAAEHAARIAELAPSVLGGMMIDPNQMSPEQLAQMAGQRNANGVIDPRFNPSTQAVLSGLNNALLSQEPDLQKQALQSLDQIVRSFMPAAPSYSTAESMLTNDTKNYEYAKSQGYTGSYLDWIKADNESKRQQTVVNVPGNTSPQFESKYDQVAGEDQAKHFVAIQNAPEQTWNRLNQMETLNNLLGDRGGFMGTDLVTLKKIGQRLGIDVDGATSADEAALSLQNSLTLQMKNPMGGAEGSNMTGTMTDSDLAFLQKTTPGLDMSPGGRAKYLEIQRRLLARQQEVAEAARQYANAHNGRLDYGFAEVVNQIRQKQLFGDLDVAGPASQPPKSGGRISNLRRIN